MSQWRGSGPGAFVLLLMSCAAFAGVQETPVTERLGRLRASSEIEHRDPSRVRSSQRPGVRNTTVRLHELSDRKVAAREDCMRVAAVFLEGKWPAGKLGPVVDRLRRRGVLRGDEDDRPASGATRGYAALLFARATGETGGVMRRLMPDSPYYAYRHLEFLGLVSPGGSGTRISGGELVSLLSLAHRHVRDHGRVIARSAP